MNNENRVATMATLFRIVVVFGMVQFANQKT